jgi:hypothetical protein
MIPVTTGPLVVCERPGVSAIRRSSAIRRMRIAFYSDNTLAGSLGGLFTPSLQSFLIVNVITHATYAFEFPQFWNNVASDSKEE